MTEQIVLDNTKRSTFRQCKKKYFLSAIKGQQSNYGSTAIRFGVTWHGIQEGFHNYVLEHGWPRTQEETVAAMTQGFVLGQEKYEKESKTKTYHDDYKNFNTAVNMFTAYLDFFKDDAVYLKVISTEKKFSCPITAENELEEKLLSKLPQVIFTGRIDLCVEMDYMKWIFDFKSTGWILEQVISKSNRSPQLLGYSYAGEKVLDFKPAGCLCSFAQVAASKSRSTGEFGNPRFDFRRVPQIFTQKDIDAWKLSFIDTAREVWYAMENDLWVESFDNCFQYGPCQYLKLCQQHEDYDNLNLEGFHQEFWDVLEGDD